jgi:hypothetical protein
MGICKFDLDNFKYNIDSNLTAMGMPIPEDIFGSAIYVLTAVKLVDESLNINAKAPLPTKGLSKVGGLLAAGWAGAVLGSAIMAANRSTRCDKREMEEIAKELGLSGSWIDEAYSQLGW